MQHKVEVNQDESRQTGVGARWRDVHGCDRERFGITLRTVILKRCGYEVWTALKRLPKRIPRGRSVTDRYEPPGKKKTKRHKANEKAGKIRVARLTMDDRSTKT